MQKHFRAPWSTRLKFFTAAFIAILIISAFFTSGIGYWIIFGIFLLIAAFIVRGYSISDSDGKLLILRMGWSTKFDLSKLTNVEYNPKATLGSIRTFGIGGVFGSIGYFHNSILGNYRAYSTNREHTVVLDFDGKKIVVTPEKPTEFVQAVKRAK
jgi:hypothetical protein